MIFHPFSFPGMKNRLGWARDEGWVVGGGGYHGLNLDDKYQYKSVRGH